MDYKHPFFIYLPKMEKNGQTSVSTAAILRITQHHYTG